MSELETILTEFRDEQRFRGRGKLAVALHVTRFAKTNGLPLNPESLVTEQTGQVAGLSKPAVQAVLKDYGITRVLAEEGGRTSRGSLGNMRNYVSFLNFLEQKGVANLQAIETWWVDRVREFFNSKPFTLRYDPNKSLSSMVTDLLDQALKRQKENPGTTIVGTVLQHLVGAKLDLILPDDKHPAHDCASTADASAGKAGDFVIDDMAIHVTTSPGEALIRKCADNINSGLRPLIVTIKENQAVAESLAKFQNIGDRVEILAAEQFIAANILEWGHFASSNQRIEIDRLMARYNEIIEIAETDQSLKIDGLR